MMHAGMHVKRHTVAKRGRNGEWRANSFSFEYYDTVGYNAKDEFSIVYFCTPCATIIALTSRRNINNNGTLYYEYYYCCLVAFAK